jgi:hypothetical protein
MITYEEMEKKHSDMYEYGFHLQCGAGWFSLIDELFTKIKEIDDSVKIVQLKEKFGGLRCYTGSVNSLTAEKVWKLISEYENKSYTVCEACGKEGTLEKVKGWCTTLCNKCKQEK